MLRNYFKTAFRNLWKTRSYSLLNIAGLAVGITCAALIFLWVEDELGYNQHFPNKEDIYIVKSRQTYDGVTYVFEATQGLLADAIQQEVPGIKQAIRMNWVSRELFTVGDKQLYQLGYYTDPGFMDIFSLEFVEGNRASAMNTINDIVLTQSSARIFFGNEPAVGKMLRLNSGEEMKVTGVVRDLPKNSTIQFNWLIDFKQYARKQEGLTTWGNNSIMTMVQLQPGASLHAINRTLLDFVKNKTNGEVTFSRNYLYPIDRWRLYNNFDKDGNEQEGRIRYVRLFSIIAWVVLLIACINFMNLATARSEKRAREVGMRKVMGATKPALVAQFLGEALLLSLLSALLAILLTYLFMAPFNQLVEKELTVRALTPAHLGFLVAIVLLCSLVAGSYPAFYLSSFNPITTLKGGKQKTGAAGSVRRGLVVLQYSAAIILIICTVIIFQQVQYVKGRDIGFDRSQVLLTSLRGDMVNHMDLIKTQLLATGSVESVGLSNMNILHIGGNTSGLTWDGKDPGQRSLISFLLTDADFVPAMHLQLKEGRNFRPRMQGDSQSILVNESFARLIRKDGQVSGQTVQWNGSTLTIVGVVKDFVYNDVYAAADPVFFYPFQSRSSGLMNIRTKAGVNLPQALTRIEKVIKDNNPGYPFEYDFLDDTFNKIFRSEMLIQQLAGVFAVLSVIISCLGLFGLAAFTAERRTREMGIRKVLGASISSLISLLNREFLTLVLVSFLVAFPLAWWIMGNWLADYQYRTPLHWWVFALAGAGALLIALLTVSSQAIRAALANPVKSLKEE
ncbi:MAG: ABC transporter permease [Candidatus Pseudobacter hemicellulosilyticus]|uniref:ABC transporter permease n=1 Tax=Candidatus Pseudobacter hemicellulosilyticus TaxID=3121375 RepID=A0AAJ5WPA7_9BACT|nr:MAG: ABC transporter permease [Pseudobacter sp.]